MVLTGLLAIVTISYLQTIHAYPSGGGAYTVVKENLRMLAALLSRRRIVVTEVPYQVH